MKNATENTAAIKDPQFWIPKQLKGRRFHQVGYIGEKSGVTASDYTNEKTFVAKESFGLAVYAR
jgi:hypothetical protein